MSALRILLAASLLSLNACSQMQQLRCDRQKPECRIWSIPSPLAMNHESGQVVPRLHSEYPTALAPSSNVASITIRPMTTALEAAEMAKPLQKKLVRHQVVDAKRPADAEALIFRDLDTHQWQIEIRDAERVLARRDITILRFEKARERLVAELAEMLGEGQLPRTAAEFWSLSQDVRIETGIDGLQSGTRLRLLVNDSGIHCIDDDGMPVLNVPFAQLRDADAFSAGGQFSSTWNAPEPTGITDPFSEMLYIAFVVSGHIASASTSALDRPHFLQFAYEDAWGRHEITLRLGRKDAHHVRDVFRAAVKHVRNQSAPWAEKAKVGDHDERNKPVPKENTQ